MSESTPKNFQPIHNPYIVGNPIKDRKMFFGREDDFKFIRQKVAGGQKGGLLVLCGTRRSGKTSILFQIINGRLGEQFLPVLIDMQAMTVESDLDFLIKVGRGIIDAIGDVGVSLEEDFLSKRSEGSLTAFQSFATRVKQKLGDKKLVLLFDEYEIFESHIAKKLISADILNLFANWIEHKEGVFIIFTGSDKLEERTAPYWGHFLGKALHRRISFLSRSDTLRLIEEPLKDVIEYEEGLPERIYELTAGQPFYTQVFAQALVDHLNEIHEYRVVAGDLRNVISQIIENPLPQMIFSWNSLGNLEKITLSIIGELNKDAARPIRAENIVEYARDERIGYQIETGALNETLEKLFHHDMLDKDDSHEAYTFKMDLWRRWMARMHSIWKVIDEIRGSDGELGEGITKARRRGRMWAVGVVSIIVLAVASASVYNRFVSETRKNAAAVVNKDFALLTVHTVPERAVVYLDEDPIGTSPIDNQRVPAGEATLRIELPGYKDVAAPLSLAKDQPFDTTVTLAARSGELKITTTPEGALVYLDGNPTEHRTPSVLSLPVSRKGYDVRVTMKGYDPRARQNVRVFEDSLIPVHLDLSRSKGSVTIESTPLALVVVDDEVVGGTPRKLLLTHGIHRIQLKKEGYDTWEQNVNVTASGAKFSPTLKELPPGRLYLTAQPYADFYINEEKIAAGKKHHQMDLKPGTYQIRLVHPTFGVETRTVEITSGERHDVEHDFRTAGKQQ